MKDIVSSSSSESMIGDMYPTFGGFVLFKRHCSLVRGVDAQKNKASHSAHFQVSSTKVKEIILGFSPSRS